MGFTIFFSCKKDASKDTSPPLLFIIGNNPDTTVKGYPYIDSGAVATDDYDGNISSKIVTKNMVNTNDTGNFQINYFVSDKAGNVAESVRKVYVFSIK